MSEHAALEARVIDLYPVRLKSPAAADYVGLSESELRTMARSGLIRAHKHGRLWMFFKADLDAMMERERRRTEHDFTPV